MKPMLASDWDESKVRFPLIAQPKIDGVRALHTEGKLTGRSLKLHRNLYTTNFYAPMYFAGLDGEMAAASEVDPALCRITSSALSSIEGEPFTLWWVFDLINPDTLQLNYQERLNKLESHVRGLQLMGCPGADHLRVIPWVLLNSQEELDEYDASNLAAGYEGTIIRDPKGMHKQGRSTVREGGLLRIKRFVEEEAVVIGIEEGKSNQNEAQINELGHTFRSTHQDNMVPNGMVGNLLCKSRGISGKEFVVGPGCMPHADREYYFKNQNELIGKIIKYKHFPKGVKDKQRFPTFQCIRSAEDM